LALAALEVLIHIDHDLAPADLLAIPIEVPSTLRVETLARSTLPTNWQSAPAPERLQELGAAWIARAASAVLRVPSVVIPEEDNYLINPTHPDCRRIKVGHSRAFTFDHRLFN
jgi:RES domain-containing protein